jgi:prephenate dehydrogenase
MNIALIGGTGKMGKLVERLLSGHDFVVWPLGRKSEDFDEKITAAEVIMISVPIMAFEETVERLSHFDLKSKLLIDMSSALGDHIEKMRKLSASVGFLHLMFGPDSQDLAGKNIIVSDETADARFASIVEVFKRLEANVTATTPEHHDQMTAITQALSQFNSISLAKTISETMPKTSQKELSDFSSTTFSMNSDVISRIVSQDAELWSAIQFNNIHFLKILKDHIQNIELLASYVESKDYEKFRKDFERITKFWKCENK